MGLWQHVFLHGIICRLLEWAAWSSLGACNASCVHLGLDLQHARCSVVSADNGFSSSLVGSQLLRRLGLHSSEPMAARTHTLGGMSGHISPIRGASCRRAVEHAAREDQWGAHTELRVRDPRGRPGLRLPSSGPCDASWTWAGVAEAVGLARPASAKSSLARPKHGGM